MAHYNTSFNIDEEAVFNPNSLQELCTQVCVDNVKRLLFVEEDGDSLTLRRDLNIPRKILWGFLDKCDHIMPGYIPMMLELCRNVELESSKDTSNKPRIRLDLNNCRVLTDSQLRQMMRVRPVSLQILNCPNLTSETLEIINEFGENLESLHLGDSAGRVLPRNLLHWTGRVAAQNGDGRGILNTPKLRHLTVGDMVFQQFNFYNLDYLECLTRSFLGGMEALELQNCKGILSLQFLLKAKDTLRLLSLQDSLGGTYSTWFNHTWVVLPKLTKIRFLDVSNGNLWRRTDILENLLRSLPDLSHLNLKGNLLGKRAVSQDGLGRFKINALASRENSPLDFINLYDTDASHCEAVPARVVVRDELFNKLMEAIKIYRHGEFSANMLDSLEIISKKMMTDNKFLWKVAFDLLLKVAGANFNPYYSSKYNFSWEALRGYPPYKLDPSQHDQIFKLVIKLLSRSWENTENLDKVMDVLRNLSERIDLWNPPYVNVLMPALVRAARTVIERCREGRETNGELFLLYRIGTRLCDNLSESLAAQIRSSLELGTLELVREAIELNRWYLDDLYKKIYDKLVTG